VRITTSHYNIYILADPVIIEGKNPRMRKIRKQIPSSIIPGGGRGSTIYYFIFIRIIVLFYKLYVKNKINIVY